MASITDLAFTNDMAANKKPFLTDLVTALTSIQTYINDSVKDNLVQVNNDAFGTAYALNSTGTRNFTNHSLFDKQTSQSVYTGGDITIATTGAWTDVDASNAAISLTPEYMAGDFKVSFQFAFSCLSSNATNEVEVRFRITDGTNNSTCIPNVRFVTGVSGTRCVVPVHITHEFDSVAADPTTTTFKLQYFLVTNTAMTSIVSANTNSPIWKQIEKI